jgi:hypothetical protein
VRARIPGAGRVFGEGQAVVFPGDTPLHRGWWLHQTEDFRRGVEGQFGQGAAGEEGGFAGVVAGL